MKAEDLGSTFMQVIERYAEDLAGRDSELILASISDRAKAQLDNTGMLKTLGRENVFLTTERIGESVTEAWYAAQKWITEMSGQPYGVSADLPAIAERFGLDKELES